MKTLRVLPMIATLVAPYLEIDHSYLQAADNNTRIQRPDVSLKLPKSIQVEDLFSVRMPKSISRYDADNDGKISLEEAVALYKDRTKTKVKRDEKGQVPPLALRQVIVAFGSPGIELSFTSEQEILYCHQIRRDLLKEYRSSYSNRSLLR